MKKVNQEVCKDGWINLELLTYAQTGMDRVKINDTIIKTVIMHLPHPLSWVQTFFSPLHPQTFPYFSSSNRINYHRYSSDVSWVECKVKLFTLFTQNVNDSLLVP